MVASAFAAAVGQVAQRLLWRDVQDAASQAALHLDIRFGGSVEAIRALNAGDCVLAGFHVREGADSASVTARTYQPLLQPGQSHTYTSGCVLATPVGSMHGSFGMQAGDGHGFAAPIQPFRLAVPGALH